LICQNWNKLSFFISRFGQGSLGWEWEFKGSLRVGEEGEEKTTAANKPGLSQLMAM